ncbi:glycosyltransferase family 39 protein [Thalassobacterium maritimum]|nr:glycosyltransferase family 39 protein [Coraliomargarita sp. SDUM461003]
MLQLILAITASAVALLIPLQIATESQNVLFVKNYSYWALAATSLLFLCFLVQSRPISSWDELKLKTKKHTLGILVIFAATAYLHLHVDRGFKILNDEPVISSTAKNMYTDHISYVPVVTHVVSGREITKIGFVDKRPGFFPFALSIVHSLTAYRPENVFWLNSALTCLLLALVYLIVNRSVGKQYGILSVLLLSSLPLLAQNTNGGGYELMNLCLISGLALSGLNYLRKPDTEGLNLLIITSILLANNRYESILYVTVPAMLFLIKTYREKSLSLTWFSIFSPLLLIVPLSSYDVFQSNPTFIQTSSENFFSLRHLAENLAHAIAYLFETNATESNSILLSTSGIIASLFLALQVVRRCKFFIQQDTGLTVLLCISLVVAVNTTLALCCYWGKWTDPTTSRFSLPFQLFLVFSIPLVLKYDFKRTSPPAWMTVAVLFFIVSITSPHSAALNRQKDLVSMNTLTQLIEWVQSQPADEANLYISSHSIALALYGNASIPIELANSMPERVIWTSEASIYKQVYAAELLYNDGNNSYPSTERALSSRFITQTVHEELIDINLRLRIVRILEVSPSLAAPANSLKNLPAASPDPNASPLEQEAYLYHSLPLPQ